MIKAFVYLVLVASLFLVAFRGVSSCSQAGEKQLALAYSMAFKGRYKEAVDAYEAALAKLPRDAYYQRVAAHKRAGEISRLFLMDYAKAIRHFKALADLEKGESGFQARIAVAEILRYNLCEIRPAIVEYQNLVKAYPEHPDIPKYQVEIGKCYNAIGDYRQAIVEASVVVRGHPESRYAQDAALLIADSKYLQGNVRGAAQDYERFLEEHPDSELVPDAAFALANCYEDMGEPDLARSKLAEIASRVRDSGAIELKMQRLKTRIRQMGR